MFASWQSKRWLNSTSLQQRVSYHVEKHVRLPPMIAGISLIMNLAASLGTKDPGGKNLGGNLLLNGTQGVLCTVAILQERPR